MNSRVKNSFLNSVKNLVLVWGLLATWSCAGWSIMGYDIDGENESVFDEVFQDSTVHYYHNLKIGQNWCFYHQQFETVELVSE